MMITASQVNILRHPIMSVIWDIIDDKYDFCVDNCPSNIRKIIELDDELANITYELGIGTENETVRFKLSTFAHLADSLVRGHDDARDAINEILRVTAK